MTYMFILKCALKLVPTKYPIEYLVHSIGTLEHIGKYRCQLLQHSDRQNFVHSAFVTYALSSDRTESTNIRLLWRFCMFCKEQTRSLRSRNKS